MSSHVCIKSHYRYHPEIVYLKYIRTCIKKYLLNDNKLIYAIKMTKAKTICKLEYYNFYQPMNFTYFLNRT